MTWRFGGADVAHYQDEAGALIDFDALRAGSLDSYFATKATQRNNYLDPTMARHRAEAHRVGFRYTSLYHWQSPVAEASIESQAKFWIAKVGRLAQGEAFMSDSEQFGITEPETYQLLNLIEDFTQQPSIVYLGIFTDSGKIYRSDRIRNSRFGLRGIHLAAYMTQAQLAAKKASLGLTAFEDMANQFGSSGVLPDGSHVPGVKGRCDMNQINNLAVFDACHGYSTQPQPQSGDDMQVATFEVGPDLDANNNPIPGREGLPGIYMWAPGMAGPIPFTNTTDFVNLATSLGSAGNGTKITRLMYERLFEAGGAAAGPLAVTLSLSGTASGTATPK